jgi:hypothetical protein
VAYSCILSVIEDMLQTMLKSANQNTIILDWISMRLEIDS